MLRPRQRDAAQRFASRDLRGRRLRGARSQVGRLCGAAGRGAGGKSETRRQRRKPAGLSAEPPRPRSPELRRALCHRAARRLERARPLGLALEGLDRPALGQELRGLELTRISLAPGHGLLCGLLGRRHHEKTNCRNSCLARARYERGVPDIFAARLLAHRIMALLLALGARWMLRIATLPKAALFPLVLALCVISAYVLNNTMALRSRRSSWARSLATRSRSTWCDRS